MKSLICHSFPWTGKVGEGMPEAAAVFLFIIIHLFSAFRISFCSESVNGAMIGSRCLE